MSLAEQYLAAKERVAVLERPRHTQLEVAGADRAKFLHNFTTNEIKALAPGQGCETFFPNVKGRVLGHGFVFAEGDAHFVSAAAGSAETLLPHLDRYVITEDVRFVDRSADWATWWVVGPEARGLAHELGLTIPGEGGCSEIVTTWRGEPALVRTLPVLSVPLLEVVMAKSLSETWREAVAGLSAPVIEEAAFEVVRIESAFPLMGRDVTEDNLAQEVGRTDRCISFRKGCYLGQEPIARLDALGHTNKELRPLSLQNWTEEIRDPFLIELATNTPAGQLTSWARHPITGDGVALGYLRTKFQAPGTLLVGKENHRLTAESRALP